jgi:UDP-3-O-[3-hydroxymyristoyl] glucosamine N-acyltransferase
VIIVNRTFEPKEPVSATLVRVDDAYAAVAALLDYVTAKKRSYKRYRGCRSRVRWSSKIGKKVYIGDFAYVGKRSQIGDYTKIYEHVYIGDDVKIGSHCIIYPGVRIYPGMVIGNNVIIHANAVIGSDGFGFAPLEDGTWKKIEHTGNVVIEDDVEIGASTCVDKSQMGSTIIRRGVKLDNLCQIAHNVEVGPDTVMAAQVAVAGSAKIGRHCIIGGQTGIAGHITIADNTSIAGQSGIMSSVKQEGQNLMGSPAFPLKQYLRSYAVFKNSGK